jgi:acyl dehydratase
VILLAPAEHVDAMVAALEPLGGRLVRHHLTADVTQALQAAVADSPVVAGG